MRVPRTVDSTRVAVRPDAGTLAAASPTVAQGDKRPQADVGSNFTVFISYTHRDNEDTNPGKRWLNRLLEHLELLVIQNQVSVWSDTEIETGEHWNSSILSQLETAKVAILLISPAFLASEYIRNSELPVLLMKAESTGVTVMQIIVRHSMFHETKFKYPDPVKGPEELSLSVFQSANPPSKPLNSMEEHDRDQGLLSNAQRILRMAQRTP